MADERQAVAAAVTLGNSPLGKAHGLPVGTQPPLCMLIRMLRPVITTSWKGSVLQVCGLPQQGGLALALPLGNRPLKKWV